jgi:transcriptional regulator with XRE-family HTH domain
LSIASAANQLCVDPGTLARWEKGQRQPEGKYLAKVYSFLGEDPRPVPATPGDWVRRQREAVGWSQRDLARRLGVYPTTVERWELGQRRPSPEHVSKMGSLLGVAAPKSTTSLAIGQHFAVRTKPLARRTLRVRCARSAG